MLHRLNWWKLVCKISTQVKFKIRFTGSACVTKDSKPKVDMDIIDYTIFSIPLNIYSLDPEVIAGAV